MDERYANCEDAVRAYPRGHLVLVRHGAEWAVRHRGIVKGEATTAWKQAKSAGEARWYHRGALVQSHTPGAGR